MAVELKQYDGQTVTAQDDAILNDQLYGLNGIISGCNMNFISINVVNIEAGYGLIKGREFKVTESTINCMLPDADGVGVIKLRMDLMNSSRPAEIITEAVSGDVYPGLEQDEDCNYNNGVFEMELARYTATSTAITEFTQTYEVLEKQAVVAIKNDIVKINEDISSLNNNLSNINVYVGEDEKLHFVDSTGADSVLPFNSIFNKNNVSVNKNSTVHVDCGFHAKNIIIHGVNGSIVFETVHTESYDIYAYGGDGESVRTVPTTSFIQVSNITDNGFDITGSYWSDTTCNLIATK